MNFWQTLKTPFFVQAPMEGVTDTVFRQILLETGKPDVFFTEFTNVDSFCSEKGKLDAMKRLKHDRLEKPLIAQIWGKTTENYFKTAQELQKMDFTGVDINMGCTEHNVTKNGCGGALINNQTQAKEIIEAVRRGAGSLPVSVKTRIGLQEIKIADWFEFLFKQKLDAVSVHVRTVRAGFRGEAHWEEMPKIVELRNKIAPQTILIGNGDVKSREDGLAKCRKYGVDGLMIGRGILNNLWIFRKDDAHPQNISVNDKIKLLIKHLALFEKTWGKTKDFNTLKKFYKVYVSGFPSASELRMKLMEFKTASATSTYLDEVLLPQLMPETIL